MKLLVVGDLNYGMTGTFNLVSEMLVQIHEKTPITEILTFDTDGVNYLSTIWAHTRKIPFTLVSSKDAHHIGMSNRAFFNVVKDNKVDAFLFVVLDNKQDKSSYRWNVRWMFARAMKVFKDRMIYTNANEDKIAMIM